MVLDASTSLCLLGQFHMDRSVVLTIWTYCLKHFKVGRGYNIFLYVRWLYLIWQYVNTQADKARYTQANSDRVWSSEGGTEAFWTRFQIFMYIMTSHEENSYWLVIFFVFKASGVAGVDCWQYAVVLQKKSKTDHVPITWHRDACTEPFLLWKNNKYYILVCVCMLARACMRVFGRVGLCIHIRAYSLANPTRKTYAPYCDVICGPSFSIIFFDIIS
jgi:hypothetical protein